MSFTASNTQSSEAILVALAPGSNAIAPALEKPAEGYLDQARRLA